MQRFDPERPDFAEAVRASFADQRMMTTLGARLARVEAGRVEIELAYRDDLVQQHGFLHAAAVAAIADSACGYAAFSLMPAGVGVLSIEYKINLLAPARGERFVARAEVVRPGRTISATTAVVIADPDDRDERIALMQATIMTIRDRPDVRG